MLNILLYNIIRYLCNSIDIYIIISIIIIVYYIYTEKESEILKTAPYKKVVVLQKRKKGKNMGIGEAPAATRSAPKK